MLQARLPLHWLPQREKLNDEKYEDSECKKASLEL